MNKSISRSTPTETRTTAKRLLSELPGQDPHGLEPSGADTWRGTGKQGDSGLHEMRETPAQAPGYAIEEVRRLAYEKFVARGCLDGHDVEDWLAAERELCDQQNYQGPDGGVTMDDPHTDNN